MKKWQKYLAAVLMLFGGCTGQSSRDIPAVSGFDAERYMGKWYEYARLPNWFERGMSEVTAEYSMGSSGVITVKNSGIKDNKRQVITGRAEFAGKPDSGELKVSFFRPFYSGYRIIKLAPDYRYSVVCGDDREYLWILSRQPEISAEDHREIINFLKENKFPVEKLIFR